MQYLKTCVQMQLWCRCRPAHQKILFPQDDFSSAQLEVHKVLKVELHSKKGFWLFVAAFRRVNLCMKGRQKVFFRVYMSKWVWEGEKEVILLWKPGRLKVENCSHWFPFGIRCKNIPSHCKICDWRIKVYYPFRVIMNNPYKLEFNRHFIQVKFAVSEYVPLVFENLDLQSPLSQLSSFLVESDHEKCSDISLHFLHHCMFHRTLKRNSNLCVTVSLPKLVNHQNF